MHRALQGIDAVYHFVAVVGVGQSMYEIADYTSVNNLGTAVLLEGVLKQKNIQRIVVASSMSIYGEGLYQDSEGRICAAADRTLQQIKAQDWEVRNEEGETLTPFRLRRRRPRHWRRSMLFPNTIRSRCA